MTGEKNVNCRTMQVITNEDWFSTSVKGKFKVCLLHKEENFIKK